MRSAAAEKGEDVVARDRLFADKLRLPNKTLFEHADGRRFATGGADARTLLTLITSKRGVTSLMLWPNHNRRRNVTTRLSSVIHRLRSQRGVAIETVMEPNVGRPGRHARYFLRSAIRRVANVRERR